jgi:hypothetical protein
MKHLKRIGDIVYINAPLKSIEERLHKMKVERII